MESIGSVLQVARSSFGAEAFQLPRALELRRRAPVGYRLRDLGGDITESRSPHPVRGQR
jgi:hypothetical protein